MNLETNHRTTIKVLNMASLDVSKKTPSSVGNYQVLNEIKLAQWRIERRLKLFEDKINAAAGLHVPIVLEDSPFIRRKYGLLLPLILHY